MKLKDYQLIYFKFLTSHAKLFNYYFYSNCNYKDLVMSYINKYYY
jgi:hypothetical protein